MSPQSESYLVIGGCGFLGRHIVEQLLARGEKEVAVFDLVQRHFDENVTFFTGDMTFPEDISNAIAKTHATVVFHTASPNHNSPPSTFHKINVLGTTTIISSCIANSVPKLIYTSSAGVVYSGWESLVDLDERLPIPEGLDEYNKSKADAEKLVLEANGREGLLTCALRPAGIFGPGDTQGITGFMDVVKNNQTKFQIGNNDNLFDWTYVGNVAHAHLLAADRLDKSISSWDLSLPLEDVCLSTGDYRIPTSAARPIGPETDPTEEDLEAAKKFDAPKPSSDDPENTDVRPVLRTKMDQFSSNVLGIDPSTTSDEKDVQLPVAGQAYFISNCEPFYFWDMGRAYWKGVGHVYKGFLYVLPASVGLVLAQAAEWWSAFSGKTAGFTKYRVKFATQKRYYDVERARRFLGYEPLTGVDEGLKKTLEWYNAEVLSKPKSI